MELYIQFDERSNEMDKFNDAQKKAIQHKDGPLLIIAGPGSGKTTVIVNRTKNLIKEYGVSPGNILVATFTKAAAKEMQDRYTKDLPTQMRGVNFGTIHSICLRILVNYFGLTYDQILKESEKYRILSNLFRKYNFDTADEKDTLPKFSNAISYIKNNGISEIDYDQFDIPEYQLKKIYTSYKEIMKENKKLDFDDILIWCLWLLRNNKKILKEIQCVYQYIMIDEFQDTNRIQAEIFFLIAGEAKNICVVGDDDQSLYQFRGAKPEIMLNFESRFPDLKKVILDINYRSDGNIVEASKEFIEKNKKRFEKNIHGFRDKEEKIQMHEVFSEKDEIEDIMHFIKVYQEEKKIPFSDMAVIYRTNRESKDIVDTFIKQNIPFRAKKEDLVDIYTHYIYNDLINFYRLAKGSKSYKNWQRAMKRPSCFVPNKAWNACKSIREVEFWLDQHNKGFAKTRMHKSQRQILHLSNLSFQNQLDYILYDIGYVDGLKDYAEFKKEDLDYLYEILDELMEDARKFQSFEDWMEHAKNYSNTIKKTTVLNENEDAVSLTTMHGSKGLEFECVFLINAADGITPNQKAQTESDLEEERRMFYVGMTRAKTHLHILYSEYYHGKKQKKSPYFVDMLKICS